MLPNERRHLYWYHAGIVVALCIACYSNSLTCGLVLDDNHAIINNNDLRPDKPVSHIFWNDFWGSPMNAEYSHKSYRPLCTLSFRLNYAVSELSPFTYHLINVILHAVVCLILLHVYSLFVSPLCGFMATLLFAAHPIHTEAVTGVVGRAELLSAIFFLAAFSAYTKCAGNAQNTKWRWLLVAILSVTVATLCKEQGITAVGVCCMYEIFIVHQLTLRGCARIVSDILRLKNGMPRWLIHSTVRSGVLVAWMSLLLLARLALMNGEMPVFNRHENSAAVAHSPTRQFTYNYLLSINSWLLLFPSFLCCDWGFGTLSLVSSFGDSRHLATILFYVTFSLLILRIFSKSTRQTRAVAMSLSLTVLPFIPATNLFFPVGFVLAERTLYTPSIGFALLVALGLRALVEQFREWKMLKRAVYCWFLVLVCAHSVKTVQRNSDWSNEYDLYRSGLKIARNNSKLWTYVGYELEKMGKRDEALEYYRGAIRVQPGDMFGHINIGGVYDMLERYREAEEAYKWAMLLIPTPSSNEPGSNRIAHKQLNLFLRLAAVIARNASRLEEADAILKRLLKIRNDFAPGYVQRANLLVRLGRPEEAERHYDLALSHAPNNSAALYNKGVFLANRPGRATEALALFNSTLHLTPNNQKALYNSAVLMLHLGDPGMRPAAYRRLEQLQSLTPNDSMVYYTQARLAVADAEYSVAESLLLQSLSLSPDHANALDLLAFINVNYKKNLAAAEKTYERLIGLNPGDINARHNLCIVYVEMNDLSRAAKCLAHVHELVPSVTHVAEHLNIVRFRLLTGR